MGEILIYMGSGIILGALGTFIICAILLDKED